MNYVFFGTPRFAEIILDRLITAGIPPVALVCNPDRPVGRKKIITPPLTKQRALQSDAAIRIMQPEHLDEKCIESLQALRPDLFVVAAYAKILPKNILHIPRLGTLGVHPSLLPLHRGSSPIQSTILAGDKKTGTAIYRMDEKMDHGPIYESTETELDSLNTNYLDLEAHLADLGAKMLITLLSKIEAGRSPRTQDETKATYTKKFITNDAFIDEKDIIAAENGNTKIAEAIVRKINAFMAEPGAWTIKNGKRVKLLNASVISGSLKISKIQEEGKKPQSA
jgi:methionyl-tRNA formyltransferase